MIFEDLFLFSGGYLSLKIFLFIYVGLLEGVRYEVVTFLFVCIWFSLDYLLRYIFFI